MRGDLEAACRGALLSLWEDWTADQGSKPATRGPEPERVRPGPEGPSSQGPRQWFWA